MKLKDISKVKTGINLMREKGALYEKHYSYMLITLKAFSKHGNLINKNLDVFISNEKIANQHLTSAGDILVRLRPPNFAILIDKENEGLLVSSLLAKITIDKNINGRYITNYINSNFAQKELIRKIDSRVIPMINIKELTDLEIVLPSIEKQQKINTILKLSQKEIQLLENLLLLKIKLNNELLNKFLQSEIEK